MLPFIGQPLPHTHFVGHEGKRVGGVGTSLPRAQCPGQSLESARIYLVSVHIKALKPACARFWSGPERVSGLWDALGVLAAGDGPIYAPPGLGMLSMIDRGIGSAKVALRA